MGLFNGKSKEERQREREWKKADAERKRRAARETEIRECYVALDQCRRRFETAIAIERNAVQRETADPLGDPERRIKRLKTAAVGLLVTRDAMRSLDSVRMEGDLNESINKLGQALKLYDRISDRSIEIKGAFGRRVETAYERDAALTKGLDGVELPRHITDRIDDGFIKDLVDGRDFDECLRHPRENSGGVHIRIDEIGSPVDAGAYGEPVASNSNAAEPALSDSDYAEILRGSNALGAVSSEREE